MVRLKASRVRIEKQDSSGAEEPQRWGAINIAVCENKHENKEILYRKLPESFEPECVEQTGDRSGTVSSLLLLSM